MKRKPKAASTDYTQAMLPQTRKAVFFDVLHLHWQKLLLLGFVLLCFAVPLLLSTVVRDIYVPNFLNAIAPDAQAEAGYALAYWEIARSIIGILFLMLFSVGLSGVLRILRQYAWLENVHIPTDFVRGIQDNCKQLLVLAFFSGLLYALCQVVLYFSVSYRSAIAGAFSLFPLALTRLLILPLFSITAIMIPVYSNSLFAHLKNALHVYTHAPLKTLLALLGCTLPWIPSIIPNSYCHLFGSMIGILSMPFMLLAWTLFCYNRFDEQINPFCCPDLIGKGIRHNDSL